ncbi:YbjQ family protein [Trueperella sp. LYQ143]|uniref:YbjQ family protein n=1 Tax=unclassified Trueperella TaxID=2630174 RepID=UPI0039836182
MLITTTSSVEGYPVQQYFGVVNGETIIGINFLKDIGAGLRDFFGGRSAGYEREMAQARDIALAEMADNATRMGANAVIGFRFDYETLGANNSMLMVVATGTAVRI